jgi:hypothetical protein
MKVFSFLDINEKSEFALCNQRCVWLRSQDGVDQTRAGTIGLTETTSPQSFFNSLDRCFNERVFQGTRSQLIIQHIERCPFQFWTGGFRFDGTALPGVTELVIKGQGMAESSTEKRTRITEWFTCLVRCLRNVRHIIWERPVLNRNMQYFPVHFGEHLQTLTWPDSDSSISAAGMNFQFLPNLTTLHLDGFHISSRRGILDQYLSDGEDAPLRYMFHECGQLESLSIKRASWTDDRARVTEPLPEAMLIKMVRHHPTLRWLSSDLSQETVTMLTTEQHQNRIPPKTFV